MDHLVINFRQSVVIAELWRREVARLGKNCHFSVFFGKTTRYGEIVKTLSESFHPDDVLCSNFVKFGRREIGEIVRY